MNEIGKLFMDYNYPEIKEICFQFLTLSTSILVLSITFSEKIVDFKNASRTDKRILVLSWTAFIFSIILCGISLISNTAAAGEVIYNEDVTRATLEGLSMRTIFPLILAGLFFVVGLVFIAISGFRSLKLK